MLIEGKLKEQIFKQGGIVGNCDFGNNVIIKDCSNYGTVEATGKAIGGIAGGIYQTQEGNHVTVINCYNQGKIGSLTETNTSNTIGGIVGIAMVGEIKNSKNQGEVNGYEFVGGIVGRNTTAIVENCHNEGNINAVYQVVGGIAGRNEGGNLTKCSNKGKIYLSEKGYYGTGGIAGISGSASKPSKIELCVNQGEVNSLANITKGTRAGGIVGNASSSSSQAVEISNCYNTGYVHAMGAVGGIVGYAKDILVQNCYHIGKNKVIGENGTIGGVLAFIEGNNQIKNNYYLESCGANYGIGNNRSNEGAEKKTEAEMKELANVLGENYKKDDKYKNNGYPILNWQ